METRPPGDIRRFTMNRTVFAHSVLFASAKTALSRGRDTGEKNDLMVAMVLSAFSLEAFLNFAGAKLIPFWSHIERIPVWRKLRVIATHLKYEPNPAERPYQTLHDLWRFRNFMAHAKTQSASDIREGHPMDLDNYPEVTWELDCSLESARRAIEDVKVVIDDLYDRAGLRDGDLAIWSSAGGHILKDENYGNRETTEKKDA